MQLFLRVSLIIYALGVGLSQSLMSLGGALLFIVFVWGFVDSVKKGNLRKLQWISVLSGVGLVLLQLMRLPWVEHQDLVGDTIGSVPLFLVPLAALFPKVREAFTRRTFMVTLGVAGVSYLVSAGWGIYQVHVLGFRTAYAAMNNPIYYAYNLLPSIAFFGVLVIHARRLNLDKKIVFILSGLCLVIFYAQILSASRTATVTGFLVLLYFSARLLWRTKFRIVLLFALLLALPSYYALLDSDTALGLKLKRFSRYGRHDSSFKIRRLLWEHHWRYFENSPILGSGYKQSRYNRGEAPRRIGPWKWGTHIYAHSIYVQSLSEAGILGSALHVTSYTAAAISAPYAWPVLGATAIAGVTENTFHNSKPFHSFLFFFFMGLVLRDFRQRGGDIAKAEEGN